VNNPQMVSNSVVCANDTTDSGSVSGKSPLFREYMHIEKWGNVPVEGIHLGETYVFPKLDGSNASLWFSRDTGIIHGGSRHRVLSLDADNQGFLAYAASNPVFHEFFSRHPELRLYGEWLVPHTLKTYREDTWRRFWVFDVYNDDTQQYLPYSDYQSILEEAKIDYIPTLAIVRNASLDDFVKLLDANVLFITDGKGTGEGIVIKNYNFYNKDNAQVWAKIICSEFKEQHHRVMGAPEIGGTLVEEQIATKFVTKALCEKTLAKITSEHNGWESKYIPELLGRIYYDVIAEEMWNICKEHKHRLTINFPTLRSFITKQIKKHLPETF